MSYYESVFIARQDITTDQVEALADGFTKIIEDEGGKVASRENWGLKGLAYRVKKNRKGHYIMLNIDAPAPAIHEMERQMRINEDVLRYLTLRVDEFEEGPSVMMRNKGQRDDRPRRPREFGGDRNFGTDKKKEAPADPKAKAEDVSVDKPKAGEGDDK